MAGDKDRVRLKRLRVISVAVARKAAGGGCVAVLERHVAERWSGVSLKVPLREVRNKQKEEERVGMKSWKITGITGKRTH